MKYKCIKSFAINKYDEDGRLIENEQHIVEAGEIYESNDKHSMIGGEIHLDNVNNKSWIELSQESLNEFFAEIWTREEILKAAKPILFNTEMVRAILDGRKTVTRRLAKNQEYLADNKQPFKVGDILYVRETFNICNMDSENNTITFIYKADKSEEKSAMTVKVSDELWDKYSYSMAENNPEWRPSIHMPKDAARIFLIVKNVRLERLKDMVLADVLMEGIEETDSYEETWERWHNTWDSTIKKSELDKYGCEANPWVFVIQFERIMQN